MWEAFVKGYRDANPDPIHVTLGRIFGLWTKWSFLTIVVVLTARFMGVDI